VDAGERDRICRRLRRCDAHVQREF